MLKLACLKTLQNLVPRLNLSSSSCMSTSIPTSLCQLLSAAAVPSQLTVHGWVKGFRKQKENTFIDLNDGSTSNHLQVVVHTASIPENLNFHSCISVSGQLIQSNHKGQEVELLADKITLINKCDSKYPFQPRRFVKPEFVRKHPTCKAKTNSIASLMRIRNTANQAVHSFFQSNDFVQIHTPILTSNDCEGGGDVFTVSCPSSSESEGPYWEVPVHLTVSGQLHLEAMCNGLAKVYNFNPAFRAERGRTRRHLSEFWMVEAEIAFVEEIDVIIRLIDSLLKHIASSVLERNSDDLRNYSKATKAPDNIPHIEKFLKSSVSVLSFDDASRLLNDADHGLAPLDGDLGRDHEQWLCKHFNAPVAVIDWPKSSKPFYARESSNTFDAVSAVDYLVEGIGELCGGSLREINTEKLNLKINETKGLEWYHDIRMHGSAPTGGFGLGFDRLIQFLAQVENIRDTLPFPRSPHSCEL